MKGRVRARNSIFKLSKRRDLTFHDDADQSLA